MTLKQILKEVGWKNDLSIIYGKDPYGSSVFYPNEKIVIDVDYKIKNRNIFFHHILHECLHCIIETRNGFKKDYLREYRVEKEVRRITKKYKLNKVLEESNKWVKFCLSLPVNEKTLKHRYAAKRIAREEKLNES